MHQRHSILVIDDDPQIRKILAITFHSNDFMVYEAATGREGIAQAKSNLPNIILLDLGLPDLNGEEVLSMLREFVCVPIVILSAQGSELTMTNALDHGAHDFVVKPFHITELLDRVKSALRPSRKDDQGILAFDHVNIDFTNRRVTKEGIDLNLSETEFSLLTTMIQNEGKLLTHNYLLKSVWGTTSAEQSHYLRSAVAHLRKHIEKDSNRPSHILTESGVGYRFMSGPIK